MTNSSSNTPEIMQKRSTCHFLIHLLSMEGKKIKVLMISLSSWGDISLPSQGKAALSLAWKILEWWIKLMVREMPLLSLWLLTLPVSTELIYNIYLFLIYYFYFILISCLGIHLTMILCQVAFPLITLKKMCYAWTFFLS